MSFPRAGISKRSFQALLSVFPNRSIFGISIIVLSALGSALASPPAVSISAPSSTYVDAVVLIDARESVGISPMPQADGSLSVTIDFGDGYSANLLASGHAYRAPGTYTITITGKDSNGATSTAQTSILVSSIPVASASNIQVISDTGNPITNALLLQNAINFAALNNSVEQEILLPAGATFAGPIVLTAPSGPNSGNKYITIRSANMGLLPAGGDRVGPGDSSNMATITAPSLTNATTPALSTPLPAPAVPSHHYRLIGLHFKKDSSNQSQVLVSLGDHNLSQNRYSMQPTNFIVDRCYFEGGSGTSNLGLRIAADVVTVKDSYFDNFKVVSGIDAVAIAISKGKGPFAIWNNYLEASSENFYIGSGPIESWAATISNPTTTSCTLSSVAGLEVDMNIALPVGGSMAYGVAQSTVVRSISGNNITFDSIPSPPFNTGTAKWAITPSFLEFRRNYCFKPLTWRPSDPSFGGIRYQIKNLWETKFLRYAVIDGNVLKNSWVQDQAFGIALTPRNTNGGEGPWDVIRELQFSNNVFWNMGNGPSIAAFDDQIGNPNSTQLTMDITFRNNVWRNVGENWDPTGGPYREFFGFTSNPSPVRVQRVHFIHNTFDNGTPNNSGMAVTVFGSNGDGSGVTSGTFKNNLMPGAGHGFFSSSSGVPETNISQFMSPGTTASWDKNFIINPNGLTYPASSITQTGDWTSQFANYSNGDFTLINQSPGKSNATDGTDIGVTMSVLADATAHAIDGQWSNSQPSPSPTVTPVPTPTPTPAATPTPTPLSASSSAAFVQLDSGTEGNWKNVYGGDGYNTVNDSVRYPSYAQVAVTGYSSPTWMASTTDIRGLQKASAIDRVAARWDSSSSFTIDLNLTDGATHQIAIYGLDWDGNNRAQRVDVLDWATNALLDSRTISSFNRGQYLVWSLQGHVKILVNKTGGKSAVVSGLYFGGPVSVPTPTPTPTATPTPTPTATPTPTPTATPTPTPTPTPTTGGNLGNSVLKAKRKGQDLSNQLVSMDGTAATNGTNSTTVYEPETTAFAEFVSDIQEAYTVFNDSRGIYPAAGKIDLALQKAFVAAYQASQAATQGDLNSAKRNLREAINNLELSDVLIAYGDGVNPIDVPSYMVRQHYVDFLNREPDGSGSDFWENQIASCGIDAQCVEVRRINVSAAFFLSIEFQQTGYSVYRLYKASYARVPTLREFLPDNAAIRSGVIVGVGGWEAKLEANKRAFIQSWTQRSDFQSRYAGLTNEQYVDSLIANMGGTISAPERDNLVQDLANGKSRADVLGKLVENATFSRNEFNSAFVLMQYFGYLGRDPDNNGFNFWLSKLNEFDGNFVNAEMVKAFLESTEYRNRFRL